MRKNLLFLIFVFGLLSGAQKRRFNSSENTFTVLIPFDQNIVIYGVDEGQSFKG